MAIDTALPSAEVVEDAEGVLDIDYNQEVAEVYYGLTSYGADFLVDGLVNRIREGDIVIPTFDPNVEVESGIRGFQRKFVWTKTQCDRFIESLLLGLPVPEIFLVREPNNVMLVLDGQQRLLTLYDFRRGTHHNKEFTLQYVQEPFRGRSYATLDAEDRRRLDNSIIHATILQPDRGNGNLDAVYLIFERINSAGTPLHPHEIRIALTRGKLIELIRKLNQYPAWRELYGPPSPRFKDHELILRFFALLQRGTEYKRPMKVFLNKFAKDYRNPNDDDLATFTHAFQKTTSAILDNIGAIAFRPAKPLNAAVADSLMVGVARNIRDNSLCSGPEMLSRYNQLLQNESYQEAVVRATADEERVKERLNLATDAFANHS